MTKRFYILLLSMISVLALMFTSNSALSFAYASNDDPWGKKEVLNYLLWTSDPQLEQDTQELQNDLNLSDKQMASLKELALREHDLVLLGKDKKPDGFNKEVSQGFVVIDNETNTILGDKYKEFRLWIQKWWSKEKEYRTKWLAEKRNHVKQKDNEVGTQSYHDTALVWATQYSGSTVALPDKYVKFANLGWWGDIPDDYEYYYRTYKQPPYTVNLYYGDTEKSVLGTPVKDCGPWNEDDNYWDSIYGTTPKRLFTDITECLPEAEAAYYWDYNNGEDQFGRTVLNPAGVDLPYTIASQLGLGYKENAWIYVNYTDLP